MKKEVPRKLKLIFVNTITLIRLIGALLLPFIYHKYGASIVSLSIIIIFLTDAIDGFLARKLNVSTFFGSMLDGLSDKLLNVVSFVILGLEYDIMLTPLILEISILYTIYSTYRYGGNIQSSRIGKIKTIILDVFVVLSFVLLSLPALKINTFKNYNEEIISVFALIIIISCLLALYDYLKKNKKARSNPKCFEIKHQEKNKKPLKLILKQLFDTNYYLKHKDESILKQFYK